MFSWRRFSTEVISTAEIQSGANETSYYFSPELLTDLKDFVNIVDVVETYHLPQFQRRGDGRAVSICPFHDDRNPSLSVDDKRKIYKCFSCGAGGDVFNFVRAYSALKGEDLTFYQAVRQVAQEFGDVKSQSVLQAAMGQPRMGEDERRALQAKKQRLLLINAAAAAYFGKSLISLPSAGRARAHLRERGLTPATVRTFALGYSPDCYYGLKGSATWGEGSLVSNLKELGFTPDEIVDSGLATRTKRMTKATQSIEVSVNSLEDENSVDYAMLIDRFRGRIMVPIFDASGNHVIAFGARIVPSPEIESEKIDFIPPKYLNSPESLVFHKSDVLFGLSTARDALQERLRTSEQNYQRFPACIVIVEGYMDVIRLWEAGIKESVACMGTALTMEQLSSAAKTVGSMRGRIILCLDNDVAGNAAVERVCSNMFLAKTAEKHGVEIVVASLPAEIKDPADFVVANSGEAFRETLRHAEDWVTWYLKRIFNRYDHKANSGTPGSFGDICDSISEFLATITNPAERTKRARDVASNLTELVAASSRSGEISTSFRIQMESDLIDMVARKAAAKESLLRRIEAVDGFDPKQQDDRLSHITKGAISEETDSSSKLSKQAFEATKPIKSRLVPHRPTTTQERSAMSVPKVDRRGTSNKIQGDRPFLRRNTAKRKSPPPMTPHFNGFEFEKESDAEWLGISSLKSELKNGGLTFGVNERYQKLMLSRFGAGYAPGLDNVVYFNSNEYHGQYFLTEQAREAGYLSDGPVSADLSLLECGVGTLIKEDSDEMIRRGEDSLLRNLVQFGAARSILQSAIASSEATGARFEIEWSNQAHEWLFTYLVQRADDIPSEYLDDTRITDLRDFLATRQDAPPTAFSSLAYIDACRQLRDSYPRAFQKSTNNDGIDFRAATLGAGRPINNAAKAVTAETVKRFDKEPQIPSDISEIEEWASNYDPAIFDEDFMMPQHVDEPREMISTNEFRSANSDDGVIDAEAVLVDTDQVASEATTGLESKGRAFEYGETLGSLDLFFLPPNEIFMETHDSASPQVRAELEVQESLATLLKASALKRLESVKATWLMANKLLRARQNSAIDESAHVEPSIQQSHIPVINSGIRRLDHMETESLQVYCRDLFHNMSDMFQKVYHLELSCQRIKARVFDYSAGDSTEGKISYVLQNELFGLVDEFVESIPSDWQPNETDELPDPDYFLDESDDPDDDGKSTPTLIPDNNMTEDEKLERDMTMIENEWSEWNDDNYRWSPTDLNLGTTPFEDDLDRVEADEYANEDDESLEEAMARIDEEWGDWNSEDGQDFLENGAHLTRRKKPLTLKYSEAEFGDYEQLPDPVGDAPSYNRLESDNFDLPTVVAAGPAEKALAEEVEQGRELPSDLDAGLDSVWE